ncbi:hypothetical protein [Saccharicrinis sp. FJH54]|uniref:hypothetical protein n=1 Tax=Saccharicrinis sp. FJH54 TaxID=3344665 RepID=UPI0035D3E51F
MNQTELNTKQISRLFGVTDGYRQRLKLKDHFNLGSYDKITIEHVASYFDIDFFYVAICILLKIPLRITNKDIRDIIKRSSPNTPTSILKQMQAMYSKHDRNQLSIFDFSNYKKIDTIKIILHLYVEYNGSGMDSLDQNIWEHDINIQDHIKNDKLDLNRIFNVDVLIQNSYFFYKINKICPVEFPLELRRMKELYQINTFGDVIEKLPDLINITANILDDTRNPDEFHSFLNMIK